MTEIITLYHGSTRIIYKPEFGKGNPHNDYGLGFYCTQNFDLAKEWASGSRIGGFANIYKLDITELAIFNLNNPESGIMEWLALLINNRVFNIASPLAAEAKDYISANFLPNTESCDLIRGLRADDSYFAFAMDFLNSAISLRQLSRAMELGELGEQFMIKSRKAFNMLQYTGNEPADGNIYYTKRLKRDKEARDQYLSKERHDKRRPDDIFMLDILREGMKRNDTRLQRSLYI